MEGDTPRAGAVEVANGLGPATKIRHYQSARLRESPQSYPATRRLQTDSPQCSAENSAARPGSPPSGLNLSELEFDANLTRPARSQSVFSNRSSPTRVCYDSPRLNKRQLMNMARPQINDTKALNVTTFNKPRANSMFAPTSPKKEEPLKKSTAMSGWMKRKMKNGIKGWRPWMKQFFVLEDTTRGSVIVQSRLMWFGNAADYLKGKKPSGKVISVGVDVAMVAASSADKADDRLEIMLKDASQIDLKAENEEAAQKWLKVLSVRFQKRKMEHRDSLFRASR